MQNYTICGVKSYSFRDKDDKQVDGCAVALLKPIDSDKGKGFWPETVYLSKEKLKNISSKLENNSSVQVIYNRYGKVDDIVDVK